MQFETYNDLSMPGFMYGTAWKKEKTTDLVELALQSGFTAIDTANQLIHYDEARVGEALKKAFDNGLSRESLFLQTKFTPAHGQDHRTPYNASDSLASQVKQSFDSSLEHLHTDFIDSYVLHGPHTRGSLISDDWEVWEAMETLYDEKKTRMIGISNVSPNQLEELCGKAKVKPMVVQNRCFAVTGWDKDVRDICKKENIVYQGFSLLTANANVIGTPEIRGVATKLGATLAQVVFKFSQMVGMLPLTGTTNETHMKEDLDSGKLELSQVEVDLIESIAI